ncbi:MAG TPA: Flp pilus assembly protein CpaB [Caulobacteraceae bacterium]
MILVAAAVAAIGLALVVRQMAANGRRPAPIQVSQTATQIPTVKVLTASHDLVVGTRIAAGDVSWQTFPAGSVNPAWIVDRGVLTAPVAPHIGPRTARADTPPTAGMTQVTGAVVRVPFLAGEPIVAGKIVRGGQGGYLSFTLDPGMRAVAIPVNAQTGVGGFILPGDRVDVMLTRKDAPGASGGAATSTVATVLRNVQILAIDQQVQAPKNAKSLVGGSATLEVPAADIETLLGAEGQGDLTLALRSYADLAGETQRGGPGARGDTVTFIRAGQVSEEAAR